jgi:putative endonuclease
MKQNETENQKIGRIGEETACKFLMKHGFAIIGRNYLKKWGEIDIIAKKGKNLHFVEVKTVSRENIRGISHETLDEYQPEENVHPKKLERLSRAIQSYIIEHDSGDDWQLDVVAVFLDLKNRKARCRYIENVIA